MPASPSMYVTALFTAAVAMKPGSYVRSPGSSAAVRILLSSVARIAPSWIGMTYVLPVRSSRTVSVSPRSLARGSATGGVPVSMAMVASLLLIDVDRGRCSPVADDELAASVKQPQVRASHAVIHGDICAPHAAEQSTVLNKGAVRTDVRMAPLVEDESRDKCRAKERGRDETKNRAGAPNDYPYLVGHARMLVRRPVAAKGRTSHAEGRSGPSLGSVRPVPLRAVCRRRR